MASRGPLDPATPGTHGFIRLRSDVRRHIRVPRPEAASTSPSRFAGCVQAQLAAAQRWIAASSRGFRQSEHYREALYAEALCTVPEFIHAEDLYIHGKKVGENGVVCGYVHINPDALQCLGTFARRGALSTPCPPAQRSGSLPPTSFVDHRSGRQPHRLADVPQLSRAALPGRGPVSAQERRDLAGCRRRVPAASRAERSAVPARE